MSTIVRVALSGEIDSRVARHIMAEIDRAITRAFATVPRYPRYRTDDELLAGARRLADVLGRAPTSTEYARRRAPHEACETTLRQRLGGWAAVRAALEETP